MEFLGIGPLELIAIILIAILVVGPRDIQKTARTLGRWLNAIYRSEFWKTLRETSAEVRNLPNKLAREAGLEELREMQREMTATTAAITDEGTEPPAPAEVLSAWRRPAPGEDSPPPSVAPLPTPPASPPADD